MLLPRPADPQTQWVLGCEGAERGAGDRFGHAWVALGRTGLPSLYMWSRATTPEPTRAFLAERGIDHIEVDARSHTITVDAPADAARIAATFFARHLAQRG